MLCSAGEREDVSATGVWAAPMVARVNSDTAISRFMTILFSSKSWPLPAATIVWLVNGADPVGLSCATSLSGADVNGVASAVGGHNVWESCAIALRVQLDPISDGSAELYGVNQDAGHRTRRDVDHVIDRPASVGVSGTVAHQEPE